MSLVENEMMSYTLFGNVLKFLPEPRNVEVSLYGDFDYKDISKQVFELSGGLEILSKGGNIFRMGNPSRRKILEIYKQMELGKKDPYQEMSVLGQNNRKINFEKAEWFFPEVEVMINPISINVKYKLHCEEQSSITGIRNELIGSKVSFNLSIY